MNFTRDELSNCSSKSRAVLGTVCHFFLSTSLSSSSLVIRVNNIRETRHQFVSFGAPALDGMNP